MVSSEERRLEELRRELLGWTARIDRLHNSPPGTTLASWIGDRPLESLDHTEVETFCLAACNAWPRWMQRHYQQQHQRIREMWERD